MNNGETQGNVSASTNLKEEDEKEKMENLLWDWLKLENQILNNRAGYFIVAQSVIFAAWSNFITATDMHATPTGPIHILMIVLPICGFLITVIWIFVNKKHCQVTHKFLAKRLTKINSRWSQVKEKMKTYETTKICIFRWCWNHSNHELIGFYLPLVFLFLWSVALISLFNK